MDGGYNSEAGAGQASGIIADKFAAEARESVDKVVMTIFPQWAPASCIKFAADIYPVVKDVALTRMAMDGAISLPTATEDKSLQLFLHYVTEATYSTVAATSASKERAFQEKREDVLGIAEDSLEMSLGAVYQTFQDAGLRPKKALSKFGQRLRGAAARGHVKASRALFILERLSCREAQQDIVDQLLERRRFMLNQNAEAIRAISQVRRAFVMIVYRKDFNEFFSEWRGVKA